MKDGKCQRFLSCAGSRTNLAMEHKAGTLKRIVAFRPRAGVLRICPRCAKWFALRKVKRLRVRCRYVVFYRCRFCHEVVSFDWPRLRGSFAAE